MKLVLSNDLKLRLLADLGVTKSEIHECFLNRKDAFERSQSVHDEECGKDQNLFFISKTDRGRMLAIRFGIKEKLVHVLQLGDREVTMEQDGIFCEVSEIETHPGRRANQ